MARHEDLLPGGVRLSDVVTLGALAQRVPIDVVRQVIASEGRSSKRVRSLPAEMTALYVVALWLFRDVSYEEVLRCLLEGLRWLGTGPVTVATKGAITQARERLGWEAMRALYQRLASPLASQNTRSAWYRKWRTVAVDGFTLDVCDTQDNADAFGYPPASRGSSAYPQIRCVGLCETGTHALFAAQMGPYATGEVTLAKDLLGELGPGMLFLADRGFFGFEFWSLASATGADLLFRCTKSQRLDVQERLPDGSFLSQIYPRKSKSRKDGDGTTVRVIEYSVSGSSEQYRLLTSILDPNQAPALELAALYCQRWEVEGAFDEIKTHLKGSKINLRSKTPDLVRQEFWGLMLAHWALRGLIHDAALHHNKDPDEISFVHAVRVVKRTLPRAATFSP